MTSDSLSLFVNRVTESSKPNESIDEKCVQPSDHQLMECIKLGERHALGLLFDRYARVVFSVSARILRNATEAQDLVQDVFLQIHQKCHQFDSEKGTVASWLLRITYSRAFNRREYLNLRGASDCFGIEQFAATEQIESALDKLTDNVFAKQILERAASELTHRQRATLEMYFFEGYTLREISTKLDESIINTRHHYYRGLEKLRAVVSNRSSAKMAAD
jgi:RNA polymerase sigma-70 factor (ECF subfamily)